MTEQSPQIALKSLLGRRLATRFEPVFKISDSNPMFDFRLLDGDRNRRILMNPFHPIPLLKDLQATRYGFIETARRDLDGMFRAVCIETRYPASSKSHASTLASSFFFRQKLDGLMAKGVTEW